METDRELLEKAAKVAGMEVGHFPGGRVWQMGYGLVLWDGGAPGWNPLTDDGDALRLAVKLNLEVFTKDEPSDDASASRYGMDEIFSEPRGTDPYAATRRAIVRAAAAIGDQHA